VPRDRVIVESKSRDTAENAAFTKQLVMPKAGQHWLLVTSAMHMPRAIGVFQKAGFTVDAYPVDYQTGNTEHPTALFRAILNNIGKTNRAVHEWIGLLVYWMAGRISVLFPGPMSEIHGSAVAMITRNVFSPWAISPCQNKVLGLTSRSAALCPAKSALETAVTDASPFVAALTRPNSTCQPMGSRLLSSLSPTKNSQATTKQRFSYCLWILREGGIILLESTIL
jgi:hypothetical protein